MNAHTIPLSKLPAIKPGCFLVLHGEQGAGKSLLARRIAMKRGKFSQIAAHELVSLAAISDALSGAPSTLIIEAEGLRHEELEHLKNLVTCSHVQVRPPFGKHPVRMPVPPVIVVSQDAAPFSYMRRAQLFLVRND